MRAVVFNGPYDVSVETVPDARVEQPSDVVVAVRAAGVCGSDLWTYRGQANVTPGSRIGHEFVGEVVEVGSDVRGMAVGDWVIAPFRFSCGECEYCRSGLPTSCVAGGFWSREVVEAGQGEFVRVPQADGTLVKVPGGAPSAERIPSLLTLSDVLPTGVHAVTKAGVSSGSTAVIIGDGAVGQCAIIAARRAGAEEIIVLGGQHSDRKSLAEQFGANLFLSERGDDAVEAVLEHTTGRYPDHVVECVGTGGSFDTAVKLARPGSTIGYVGLPHGVNLDVARLFARNIGIAGGVASARYYAPLLLDDVLEGRLNSGAVFTAELGLEQAALAYQLMDERRTIKALLKPEAV
ncbi:MAG: IMP dehydrogenase [Actinobacteria bacterium HGW-Actinobacteria-2]|nr:MAG: IMP dehydrogenase [Actinobacteria bacterium HGW-Actinobacteria-2]